MANNSIAFQTLQQSVPAGKVLMREPGTGTGPVQLVDVSTLATHITAAGASAPAGGSGSGGVTSGDLDTAFGSTQGSILYRGASVWTTLGPGTSGQFLKTQGASANPVWAAAGGSGGLSLIGTQTASASSTLPFTGLDDTKDYLLIFDNIVLTSTAGTILLLQFGTGGTPTWQTSSYRYQQNYWGSGGSNGTNISESASGIELAGLVTSAPGTSGNMTIRSTMVYGQLNGLASDGHDYNTSFAGRWTGGTPMTAVQLLLNTGGITIASGTVKLYQYG